MERIELSVVVIGLNEGLRLTECLHSVLSDLKTLNMPFELYYVDSHSTDSSVERAQRLGVAVLQAGRFGAARARNTGWKATSGKYVQFLDGDMCVEPGWFKRGLEAIQAQGVGAVFGRLRELHADTNPYCAAFGLDWNKPAGPADFFGGAVMVRRDVLAQLGGYDEHLRLGEDPELSIRFRQAGFQILSVAEPMATHDLGLSSFGGYWRRAKAVGRSRVQVFKKSLSWKTGWRAASSIAGVIALLALVVLATKIPFGLPILAAGMVLRWFRLVARDLWNGASFVASVAHGSHLVLGKLPEAQGALAAFLTR